MRVGGKIAPDLEAKMHVGSNNAPDLEAKWALVAKTPRI